MDSERLRADLRDYYGTAMFNGNPMAMMELEEVERASASQLRDIARENGFDLDRYESPRPSASYDGPSFAPSPSRTGVSISTRTELLTRASTAFFEPASDAAASNSTQPTQGEDMAFTINAEADKLMNKAIDDLDSQLKSAESRFESDGRLLEIRSSYTIRDMTDLADIVSESNRITDELYASYEALVRAANSICKPLADQGVAPETLSRLVKMLEHINAECSTLGSNFSASIDSYSLGGIASTRYSPSTEARMIEANWRMLHDMHPLVAEEKARREEKARIERERREEERRIAREKALEDYPARLAAWKQETSRVEAVRGHLMEEARMQERKRLLDEANQAYQAAQGRAEEKAREGGRLRQQANAQLQTLSFFKFGEKMRANEQIIQGEQMIQQADQMLQQAEEEYQSAKADIAKNLERAMERRRRQIEGENPLPSKPRDPNSTDFFSSSSAEAVTAVQKANMSIKEAIYETLLEIGPATITDVMMACDEAAEISNQRVSALLRQLVSDGRVERYEEKRKAFFRAIEY